MKSECDNHEEYDITLQNGISKSGTGEIAREDSGLDPNRHCANVNTTDPVPADCCGVCMMCVAIECSAQLYLSCSACM